MESCYENKALKEITEMIECGLGSCNSEQEAVEVLSSAMQYFRDKKEIIFYKYINSDICRDHKSITFEYQPNEESYIRNSDVQRVVILCECKVRDKIDVMEAVYRIEDELNEKKDPDTATSVYSNLYEELSDIKKIMEAM